MIRDIRNLDGNGQRNRQVELSRTFLPSRYSQGPVHNAGQERVKSKKWKQKVKWERLTEKEKKRKAPWCPDLQ